MAQAPTTPGFDLAQTPGLTHQAPTAPTQAQVKKAPAALPARRGPAPVAASTGASVQAAAPTRGAAAATASGPRPAAANAPTRVQAAARPASTPESAAMQARIDRLTREVVPLTQPYDIGVSIRDNRSGRVWSYRGGRAYSQASLVKLGTSAGVFLTAGRNKRAVTSQERAWMKRALQVSDNPSQSALWSRIGGNSGYTRAMSQMGLSSATKPVSGRGWGYSFSTPNDQVKLMTALLNGDSPLKPADAQWLLTTMRGVSKSQTWGAAPFGADSGRTIEVKNGWAPYRPDYRWRLTSLGHIKDSRHDYTIAIMSNGWGSSGAGIPKLDAIGRKVYNVLGY